MAGRGAKLRGGVEGYLRASAGLWAEAERLLAEGDVRQASEKFWGAAALAVKAVAEARGWPHDSHRALWEAVRRLRKELDAPELTELFGLAGQLHVNYYEGWLDGEEVSILAGKVKKFVELMGQLAMKELTDRQPRPR